MKPTFESGRTKPSRYLVIGNGRWATHLKAYLKILNLPFDEWNRAQPTSELQAGVCRCSQVLLAISDSTLKNFFMQHLQDFPGPVVHFSGAVEVPPMIGVHPLMTFGPELYREEVYRNLPMVTTSSLKMDEILPGFPNALYRIQVQDKAYYHALCVLGGNLTTILLQKMIEGLGQMDLPKNIGQAYLQQVLSNVFSHPESALTGPLVRKDTLTVEKNLLSLELKDPRLAHIYQAFIPLLFPEFKKEVRHENSRL